MLKNLLISLLVFLTGCSAQNTISEIAHPRQLPVGAPKYSDVCFSSRWPHPRHPGSRYDTFESARAFYATRLDWVYSTDAGFIKKAKSQGYAVTPATSTILEDIGSESWQNGRMVDINGEFVTSPWMRRWAGPVRAWGCVSNPVWQNIWTEYVRKCLDDGAFGIQHDDPGFNYSAIKWGGCFCDFCVKGFTSYLKGNFDSADLAAFGIADIDKFNYKEYCKSNEQRDSNIEQAYKDFQMANVLGFHEKMRKWMNEYAGRYVPYSCNNTSNPIWTSFYSGFDFGMGELYWGGVTPKQLWERALLIQQSGRAQVYSMPKIHNSTLSPKQHQILTRREIATTYALGYHTMVPWDVYQRGGPRYFGKPEQYADLYGFVRAVSGYLDGYEYAAAFGKEIDVDDDTADILDYDTESDVYVFVRAVPKAKNKPVVMHVVNWSDAKDAKEPIELKLNLVRFFGGSEILVTMLTPKPYSQSVHEQAIVNADYGLLREKSLLDVKYESGYANVIVPAGNLWTLLVIESR